MLLDRRWIPVALVVLLLGGAGVWLLAGAGGNAGRKHVVSSGVPLDEVHPANLASGERRPGIVVAHGFAGSARLMTQFGDTLAAHGYVVVLLDFSGHGANRNPLPDDNGTNDALQQDLSVAVAHLRTLPDVDPFRIGLVGHSMGATAVTRYAAEHPDIAATVAISLPDGSVALPGRPANLLLLVGGLEFPGFHRAADQAIAAGAPNRRAKTVPGVEHISILYAPRAHRATAAWLDSAFGNQANPAPAPSPVRRVSGAALLMLALAIGLVPLGRLLLGPRTRGFPRLEAPLIGRAAAVAAVAAIPAALLAPLLPTADLPLALGGYLVGLVTVTGILTLGYALRRRTPSAATPIRPRLAVAAPVLIGYAAVAIAAPLHLGLTYAVPTGTRWWLLAVVWAAFAILAYAAERLTAGNSYAVLAVSAVAVAALSAAAVFGLTSTFVLLVVPLLAVLLCWQAAWSAVLHTFAAPAWLIALAGSLLVAWPMATALPILP